MSVTRVQNPFFLSFYLPILSPPRLDLSLPSIPRHLPDDTLSSKFAIKLRINTLAALIDVKTLTALLTESCLMLLADRNRLPIRMNSTSHLFIPFTLIIPENSFPGQRIVQVSRLISYNCNSVLLVLIYTHNHEGLHLFKRILCYPKGLAMSTFY